MFKKLPLSWILTFIVLIAAAGSSLAADVSVHVNLNFNFDNAYPECPIPSQAVVVQPRHKHYGNDWTEYQVGYPSRQMILIYNDQMPRNGWRYDHEDNGVFYWVKGHRLMRISILWIGPHRSIVAFSETRIKPAHDWKDEGYKDQWNHGKHGKKHHGGYKEKDDED